MDSPAITVLTSSVEGGVYDALEYQWIELESLNEADQVVPATGTLVPTEQSDTVAHYTPGPDTPDGFTARVLLRVVAIGRGVLAADGSRAPVEAMVSFPVGGLVAPELAIAPVGPIIGDHQDQRIEATETGGNYDTITRAWSVHVGAGTILSFTPPSADDPTAVGLYTPPTVVDPNAITVRYSVAVQGTGVRAPVATEPVVAFVDVMFTVRHYEIASVPELRIEGPASIPDNASVTLTLVETGGEFDAITRSWQSVGLTENALPAGTATGNESDEGLTATYQPPDVDSVTMARVRCIVAVRGEGRNAGDMTSAEAEVFHDMIVYPFGPARPPRPSISGEMNITDVQTLTLTATESGIGIYDTIVRSWAIIQGSGRDGDSGTLTQDPDDENVVVFTPPNVDSNTVFSIQRVITVTGTGMRAEADSFAIAHDNAIFIVADSGAAPAADAPALSLSGASSIKSNETLELTVTETGGNYDTITRGFSVVKAVVPGSAPEENDANAHGSFGPLSVTVNQDGSFSVTAEYRPGTIAEQVTRSVTVRYNVEVGGDGTVARDATSDAAASEATFDVVGAPPLPDATAPTVVVTGAESIREHENLQLTATVTKGDAVYDAIRSETWTVSRGGGTFDPDTAGRYLPPTLRDDETEREVRVRYVVVVEGDGTTARRRSTATAFREVSFDVTQGIELPVATAPTVVVTGAESIREHEDLTLTATWSKGAAIYDDVDSEGWSVSVPTGKDAGTIVSTGRSVADDGTVTATARYTPGVIAEDDQFAVTATYSVEVSGDGTTARLDTTATGEGSALFDVVDAPTLPDATPPDVLITAFAMKENETQQLSVEIEKGDAIYDVIDFQGWVGASVGTISSSGLYTPPDVASNTDVTVTYVVDVSGDGTTARNGSNAEIFVDKTFTVVDANTTAVAPTLSISLPPGVTAIDKDRTLAITATESGGVFDTFESDPPGNGSPLRSWTVVSGGGTIVQTSVAPSGRVRATYTPDRDITEDTAVEVRYRIAVKGNGNLATDGTAAVRAITASFTVRNVLDEAEAPDLEISVPDEINENTSATFTAMETGGRWDDITRTWSISPSSAGSINAETGQFRAANQDGADVTMTVTYEVRVSGDGTTARANTRDRRTATATATILDVPVPVLDVADAPGVTISGAPSFLSEDSTATLTARESGGRFDRVDSRTWQIVTPPSGGGTLTQDADDDKVAVYDPPDVSENLAVTLRYSVEVSGTGQTARVDTEDTATGTVSITVTPAGVLLDAEAPDVEVSALGSIDEDETHTFTATETGGRYDSITRAWSVVSGGGSISSSGVYSPPNVSSDTVVRVRRTVTVEGTGTRAANNTSDTASDDEVFTVRAIVVGQLRAASAPTPSITPLSAIDEDDTHTFTASESGGLYDTISRSWSVESGGGSITSSGVYTPPDVSVTTTVVVKRTISVTGTGNNARINTSDTKSDTETFSVRPVTSVVLPPASVSVSITGATSIRSTEDLDMGRTLSGTYDDVDSETWTVVSGGGSISNSGFYDPPTVADGATITVTVRCSVTVSGDGTTARPGTTATDSDTASFTVVGRPVTKPSASVTVTISPANPSIKENEDQSFSYSLSGTYDRVDSVSWSASPGAISSSGLYTPPSVGPSGARASIDCRVTVSGTGGNARTGTSDTDTDRAYCTIIDVPTTTPSRPNASVSVTVTGATSIKENEDLDLGYSLSGTYDDVDSVTWSVVSGGGSINSNGRYSPPSVSSNRSVTVRCRVTVSGDGTRAKNGTTDTDSDTASFTVIDVSAPPAIPDCNISVSITGATSIKENEDLDMSYRVTGPYDRLDSVSWSVVSGGGSINNNGSYSPPNVSSNTTVTVEIEVEASGTGTNARSGTSDTDSDTASFTVVAV